MSQPGTWPTPPPADGGTTAQPPAAAAPENRLPAAAGEAGASPHVVRRRQRMVPRPPAEDEGPVVNRDVLANASRSTVKPQTRRNRQLVGSLPGWEPLPPGEVVVSKPRSTP